MKILIAYDGSEASHKALERGAQLAKQANFSLHVLTVIEPLPPAMYPGFSPTGEPILDWQSAEAISDPTSKKRQEQAQIDESRYMESGQEILKRAEAYLKEQNIAYDVSVKIGAARTTICEVAKAQKAEILLVGARGLGLIKRLMLGSTSQYLVHHAPCSVFVVRDTE